MSITLIVSVGGTPAPVIASLRKNLPARVVFFVSPGSRSLVAGEILPALLQDPGVLPDHEFVVTPDAQDLGESVYTLLRDVPAALQRLGATEPWPALVDYTAGTKTMSAALVLASSRHPSRLSYVGSVSAQDRTKEGLGVVVDGREMVIWQENPWNRIAWIEIRTSFELFNRGQYGNAAELVEAAERKVDDPEPKRLYRILAEVFRGFQHWDIFSHNNALKLLGRSARPLLDLAQVRQSLFPELPPFAEEVIRLHDDALKRIKPGELSWEMIQDLLANARRRADLEGKFDDAVARCYCAIERIAQHRLKFAHGIDPSEAQPELLPESLREEYRQRYSEPRKSGEVRLKFPAIASYRVLLALGDDVGLKYGTIEEKLRNHMDERNHSILAHGMRPMDRAKFEALFADAIHLFGVPAEDLWQFPKIGA